MRIPEQGLFFRVFHKFSRLSEGDSFLHRSTQRKPKVRMESVLAKVNWNLMTHCNFTARLAVKVLLGLSIALAAAWDGRTADSDFFEQKIRPILADHCYSCHSAQSKKVKGELLLDTREGLLKGGAGGPVLVPGAPDKSRLIEAVRYDNPDLQMPPKEKLSATQIADLIAWTKMGAPDPRTNSLPHLAAAVETPHDDPKARSWWAFQPVKTPALPKVKHSSWVKSPVDNFILSTLEARNLKPAPAADKATLIRRATFDLTGLPPTPDEIHAFLSDKSPTAFATVVDRLLASPAYGQCWARHWLDVVRYADARDLIQLPPESDFREIWRYRDWVVDAFNRDLPYNQFVTWQLAGDLVQPHTDQKINREALIATGMLAIADFVPGDVDKEQMIADYVNDEIDVVGRGFLGLTLACARCHDHKFDPISTEDYYGLAGIFFSTRVVPAPVPGNTPLIRMPLLPQAELDSIAENKKRITQWRAELKSAADLAHRTAIRELVTTQTARYLTAAWEFSNSSSNSVGPAIGDFAKQHGLEEQFLTRWLTYLRLRGGHSPGSHEPATLLASLRENLRKSTAGEPITQIDAGLRAVREQQEFSIAHLSPTRKTLVESELFELHADDSHLMTDSDGRLTEWLNRAGRSLQHAIPVPKTDTPQKAVAMINGRSRTVLRFSGKELLQVSGNVPAVGTLFLVYKIAEGSPAGQRLVGWEDANAGKHGVGLLLEPSGELRAVLRKNGASGDLSSSQKVTPEFEILSLSWGPRGTILRRNRELLASGTQIDAVSSDPAIEALNIGGPGSGNSAKFHGDLAEARVYDGQLDEKATALVEEELYDSWLCPETEEEAPLSPVAILYAELASAQGPFWFKESDQSKWLAPEMARALADKREKLEALEKTILPEIPYAVVVQEGGPKDTKHEGFKDSPVFLRGNPKNLGKTVPRGFPHILAGDVRKPITEGSGRLQLAQWITNPENPLTARVMVNRIWQHHFGEGIVRTPNNFGARGIPPTHPELLDYLASQFVESGWSIKSMHRLIMLSSVYQLSSDVPPKLAEADPENDLLGRMNRRPLDAEAMRDSLLAVAGHLDLTAGGIGFQELAKPRRTLYLMSIRTGGTNGFGPLFDRPDGTSIIENRTISTVAPQALFLLNDPFVLEQATALAAHIKQGAARHDKARIQMLYRSVLGREPTHKELSLGLGFLSNSKISNPWDRYCQVLLCSTEFSTVN